MFRIYNNNPYNEKLSDCVCRAISLATGADYYDVSDLLLMNAEKNDCECLNCECYSKMLDEIGYKQNSAEGKTVSEVAEEHKDKKILIRIEGHLTCSINGDVYDLWDCTDKKADKYWIVE